MGFILPIAFTTTPYLLASLGGLWVWAPLILALVIIPPLDFILPRSQRSAESGPSWFFDSILYIYVFMHVALVVWGAWFLKNNPFTPVEKIGFTISMGVVTGGIGITFAHELVHRKNRVEKLMGELILVFVCYGHFAVAHVYGHHRNVGTPNDPATAPKGMSLYRFYTHALPRVFAEALRLRQTQTLIYTTLSIAVAIGLKLLFGLSALWYFLGQSLVAALLLEAIDYIEHYGLTRTEVSPQRYESVRAEHSWDSDALITGQLLIHLQRHSDHHLRVLKKYPDLELIENRSQLPTGYAGMLLLAFVPPLWFKVMDARINANKF